VTSARELLHEQGVERTTLAEVAEAAEVPAGNVYYYFKTKDELVEAAIGAHLAQIEAMLASLERHRSPQARLKALVRAFVGQRTLVARSGCPHGSLCQELDKRNDDLRDTAAELIALPLNWAEEQFRQMERRDARDLAITLIASYQGIALLTNTFREEGLMQREGRRLEHWIDSLT
jgi:AcrR family transcriptional regulator